MLYVRRSVIGPLRHESVSYYKYELATAVTFDGATVCMLRFEDGTKPQPKSKAKTGKKWKKKARVDHATRPTDTTDTREKKKADLPPSSDTTAISGSKPDEPARNNGPLQGQTVLTATVTPGPVKKRKSKCRWERDSRKWGEHMQRIKARYACPDVPGAAQEAPSTSQVAASREPEPDPSPPHLRPLAHRVTARPDPPTQSALEVYGLSDIITEPDPDLCVETEHHLPVPARPSQVYKLYRTTHGVRHPQITRCLHNTLTDRVAVWSQYTTNVYPDNCSVRSATEPTVTTILILPEHEWTTYSPEQYKKLHDMLKNDPIHKSSPSQPRR
jgi:hypothetical protein